MYLLSFHVRQRHVQFNCLLTRDKIEFHESPFEENSERLYYVLLYVPILLPIWYRFVFCAHDHSKLYYMRRKKKRGMAHFPTCGFAELNFFGHEI